jgi:hypothetical protein
VDRMALPFNSVIETNLIGTLLGQTVIATFHHRVVTPSTLPNASDELAAWLGEQWNNVANTPSGAYINCCPLEYTNTRVTAQAIEPTRLRRVTQVRNHPGDVGNTEVSNLQASVTFFTNLAGRSQIGGKRIPMAPDQAVDGFVSEAYKTLLTTFAANCVGLKVVIQGGAVYAPCIYHRAPTVVPTFTDIEDAIPQDTVRVMRRRTVGLGI